MKEPGTLDWIDQDVRSGETIYEIGANIGQYGRYAALRNTKDLRVICFEPESANYAALNENIMLNGLSDCVTAYPMAIGEGVEFCILHVQGVLAVGGALHQFGHSEDGSASAHQQGVLAASLDALVYQFGFPCPAHMKLDVDGHELAVVHGAEKLLADERLKSVLIEVDTERDAIHEAFAKNGFALIQEQPSTADATTMNMVFRWT